MTADVIIDGDLYVENGEISTLAHIDNDGDIIHEIRITGEIKAQNQIQNALDDQKDLELSIWGYVDPVEPIDGSLKAYTLELARRLIDYGCDRDKVLQIFKPLHKKVFDDIEDFLFGD